MLTQLVLLQRTALGEQLPGLTWQLALARRASSAASRRSVWRRML